MTANWSEGTTVYYPKYRNINCFTTTTTTMKWATVKYKKNIRIAK